MFGLAYLFRRPVGELNMSAMEFWYWQSFLSDTPEKEPEQTPEQMLAFMRGITNG